jgi:anaerobic magnesium-protoporphyrin IX monomethyl ester cyclase
MVTIPELNQSMQYTAENLKVALVSVQSDAERVPPIGLVYLATYLRDVTGLKSENIRIFDQNYTEGIEAEIEEFAPSLIGFSTMAVTYGKTAQLARRLRPKCAVPFILGGVHISTMPMSLDPMFDVAVLGEGELTLHELIQAFLQHQGLPKEQLADIKGLAYFDQPNQPPQLTAPRPLICNLDELPIPDFRFACRDYFTKDEIPAIAGVGIRAYVFSSRGCPYRCTFCSTAKFWDRIRYHSPDYTARLVKHFIDEFGSDYLKIEDDLFTVSAKRLREMRAAFVRHGILDHLKAVECHPRANLINEELCEAMRDLKIKVANLGFESGSDRILKSLKVGTASVEQNKKVIQLCNQYGIYVYGSLMYGVPGETLADMEKTNDFIDFCIENGARYIWSFVATPFPDTPFWEEAVKRGKVSNQMDWEKIDLHNTTAPLLLDDGIDLDEFRRVFMKGRRKLRKLKARMILQFLMHHPIYAMWRTLTQPKRYLSVMHKWFFKQ